MDISKGGIFVGLVLTTVVLLGISMLVMPNDDKSDMLQNEQGVVVDGGGFGEGATLVSNKIATNTEEATGVLAVISNQIYNRAGDVHIFDIHVTDDGAKVQPNGKVKVSVPVPDAQTDSYLVFHVKGDNSVESLVSTVADGKITFETSSFSYFIITEAVPTDHVHDYVNRNSVLCGNGLKGAERC